MDNKKCVACSAPFQPPPQVSRQSYCSAPGCQLERRKQWLQLKLQADADYRDNQTRAQQAWSQRNPNYWRQYRESHPDYVDRNRAQQRGRDGGAVNGNLAKMDVWIVKIIVRDRQTVPRVDLAKR